MKRVVIVQRIIAPYRVPFYRLVKELLNEAGIELSVVYGQPAKNEREPHCELDLGLKVRSRYLHIRDKIVVWVPCLKEVWRSDLVVLPQSNKNLVNYVIIPCRKIWRGKVGLWGHGKNLQLQGTSLSERFKRIYSKRVDWWFAYNEYSAEVVRNFGFSSDRITSVNNAVDIQALRSFYESVSLERITAKRQEFGIIEGQPVGIFCSRLYGLKRIPFLLDCVREIKERVPDFHFIVIGDGVDAPLVSAFQEQNREWFHWVGAKHSEEKVILFRLAHFQLMPGAVGLNIVESFALLTPLITTRLEGHGPEIIYLKHMENGVMTPNSVHEFSEGVFKLINDRSLLQKLVDECEFAREEYTIGNMAQRFVDGVQRALEC